MDQSKCRNPSAPRHTLISSNACSKHANRPVLPRTTLPSVWGKHNPLSASASAASAGWISPNYVNSAWLWIRRWRSLSENLSVGLGKNNLVWVILLIVDFRVVYCYLPQPFSFRGEEKNDDQF